MDDFKSHFQFNKQERSGIFFLLLLIGILLLASYWYKSNIRADANMTLEVDVQGQKRIDSLKLIVESQRQTTKKYPYNPNFITDYKGYVIGLSVEEIDRLHRFREAGKFVNSVGEFQEITLVSDSLLAIIGNDFKFPEWVKKKDVNLPAGKLMTKTFVLKDINTVTAQELKKINGIGEKLSTRIVKFRDRLGGFRTMDLLYDVYGLEGTVIERIKQRFEIQEVSNAPLLDINKASEKELAEFVYFGKSKARKIAAYRYAKGKIVSLEDLFNNIGIPINKIDRIALYLSF